MKIKKVISLLCTAAMLLAVPAGNVYAGAEDAVCGSYNANHIRTGIRF